MSTQFAVRSLLLKVTVAAFALAAFGIALPNCAEQVSRMGPLTRHSESLYFVEPSGKAVYLTGSHTWANLQDRAGHGQPLQRFDYADYLDLLKAHGHNFIRLWCWENNSNGAYHLPNPFRRSGPGTAKDGQPKWDVTQFDEDYFERLRQRVAQAREQGIYVSVMLFQGWSIYDHGYGQPFEEHWFHSENNINGIDGSSTKKGFTEGMRIHNLDNPEITHVQERYVRKVIETVNDLDNVLYEITNESGWWTVEWQKHMIDFVHDSERTMPQQHPVGMTSIGTGDIDPPTPEGFDANEELSVSNAEWISPGGKAYVDDPPPADGRKVSLLDTDHVFGVGGDRKWIWKAFTRGHQPIYMDDVQGLEGELLTDETLYARRAMGHTLEHSRRVHDLSAMRSRGDLSSTEYCLANPGSDYLIFQPKEGGFDVFLEEGSYTIEWFNPQSETKSSDGELSAKGWTHFEGLPGSSAVLFVSSTKPSD